MLLSKLARHTANILRDPRVSLLLSVPSEGDPLAAARLTIIGGIVNDERTGTRETYLRHLPDAAKYADFADFAFWRVEPASAHLVAGFGRIVSLSANDLIAPAG